MRTRTILNSKGEAIAKEIQIEIKGKGGELGKKAMEELVKLIRLLQGEETEDELMKIVYTITGFVFCCEKCGFITGEGAHDILELVGSLTDDIKEKIGTDAKGGKE